MKTQVLDTGCPKCRETLARVHRAAGNLDIEVDVEKVERIQKIMASGRSGSSQRRPSPSTEWSKSLGSS